jgi:ferredoxin
MKLNKRKYFCKIGACEGTLSCSTCHLIFKKENYETLKPASDEENDMLDLAFGLTETLVFFLIIICISLKIIVKILKFLKFKIRVSNNC